MKIRIRETAIVKALSIYDYTNNEDGVEYTEQFLRQAGALDDGQFVRGEDGIYVADDETWWRWSDAIAAEEERQRRQEKIDAARRLAEASVAVLESYPDHANHVLGTVYVGMDNGQYWVTDNGEEVNGLTREQAIDIIVENLSNEDE